MAYCKDKQAHVKYYNWHACPLKKCYILKDLSLVTKLSTLVQQTMSFGKEFHTLTVLLVKKIVISNFARYIKFESVSSGKMMHSRQGYIVFKINTYNTI